MQSNQMNQTNSLLQQQPQESKSQNQNNTNSQLEKVLEFKRARNVDYFKANKALKSDDGVLIDAGASMLFSNINLKNPKDYITFIIIYQTKNSHVEGLTYISVKNFIQYLMQGIVTPIDTSSGKADDEIIDLLKK